MQIRYISLSSKAAVLVDEGNLSHMVTRTSHLKKNALPSDREIEAKYCTNIHSNVKYMFHSFCIKLQYLHKYIVAILNDLIIKDWEVRFCTDRISFDNVWKRYILAFIFSYRKIALQNERNTNLNNLNFAPGIKITSIQITFPKFCVKD